MFGANAADNEDAHDEDNTADESEAEESSQDEGESEADDSDGDTVTLTKAELEERDKAIRKDQDKRWKQRRKGGEDADEGSDEEGKAEKGDERYDRLELKTEGITVKEEQDAILEYAKFKKIPVIEALNTPAVKAELREMRDKASTPAPSRRNGGGASTDTVEYWVAQYKKGGKSAPTVEMRRKVRKALQNGA